MACMVIFGRIRGWRRTRRSNPISVLVLDLLSCLESLWSSPVFSTTAPTPLQLSQLRPPLSSPCLLPLIFPHLSLPCDFPRVAHPPLHAPSPLSALLNPPPCLPPTRFLPFSPVENFLPRLRTPSEGLKNQFLPPQPTLRPREHHHAPPHPSHDHQQPISLARLPPRPLVPSHRFPPRTHLPSASRLSQPRAE